MFEARNFSAPVLHKSNIHFCYYKRHSSIQLKHQITKRDRNLSSNQLILKQCNLFQLATLSMRPPNFLSMRKCRTLPISPADYSTVYVNIQQIHIYKQQQNLLYQPTEHFRGLLAAAIWTVNTATCSETDVKFSIRLSCIKLLKNTRSEQQLRKR